MGSRIPVTIFTGYLGAGKTSVILGLVKQFPPSAPGRRLVWLKNEFGEAQVDSLLAQAAGIRAREVVNGCLCCVAVGHLGDALRDLVSAEEQGSIDRIVVETSGSAYPAPLAWAVREAAKDIPVVLDGVVTVVDCLNFDGYPDKSRAAKLQARYTDLILLNKVDLVASEHRERKVDAVLDELYELNPDTPVVHTGPGGHVTADLVFGLETSAGRWLAPSTGTDAAHMQNTVDLLELAPDPELALTHDALAAFAKGLDAGRVFRAKGFAPDADDPGSVLVLNAVAGRHRIDRVPRVGHPEARFVLMGDSMRAIVARAAAALGTSSEKWKLTPKHAAEPAHTH